MSKNELLELLKECEAYVEYSAQLSDGAAELLTRIKKAIEDG